MAYPKNSFGFGVVAMLATLIFALSVPAAVHAQTPAPAPAPTSDGSSVDQGIAYVLMLLALVLTYLVHSADISSSF
ncbi:arabinogalactan protein 41-like [Gastrolobium bilobum]|uniref:arabinogalactan protein 41-like n=1 Tax=Gastrolobium bilobum TaxID=150636 RepID=UPI002AAFABE5|nr:arabinogalactan protein 41-like [Gastrolobium bilobum]